jgi:hypothetical protein
MLKRLRIAVTALSLTVCVLLIALWVRSEYTVDFFHHLAETWHSQVISHDGKINVNWGPRKIFLPPGDTIGRQRLTENRKFKMQAQRNKWRETGRVPMPETNRLGFRWFGWGAFVMPYWFPVALTLGIAALAWMAILRRFSLRTLLIAVTLVVVVLGIVVAAR